ncbi:hypothetical protein LX36DRAFT_49039 [Colletotrichum falcatum]|nr:hypothetical protein LX36DRAFT_49039 [Colletotrichum falcatum]
MNPTFCSLPQRRPSRLSVVLLSASVPVPFIWCASWLYLLKKPPHMPVRPPPLFDSAELSSKTRPRQNKNKNKNKNAALFLFGAKSRSTGRDQFSRIPP